MYVLIVGGQAYPLEMFPGKEGGANIQIVHYFDHAYLEEEKINDT